MTHFSSDLPVPLGIMPPLSGLVKIYGPEIAMAAQIAAREVNASGGILGRPLRLVIEDDGSLPESAIKAANRLLDRHGCIALVGNLLSNSRTAVAYRVAEPRRVPLLNFSFYEGSILSRYFFHFAALPNQQIDHMIPHMKDRYGPRMFFAGNSYEWPRGSIDAAKRSLLQAGGEVVGEEYLPIGVSTEQVAALLRLVEQAAPEVFVPYFAGADQITLLTGFTAMGLRRKIAVVMGHYDEMMASQLPPEVRDGHYSSNTYFMTIATEENRKYLEQLAASPGINGIWPQGNGILTNFGEGAYLCVKAFAQAANQAESLDREAIIEALATISVVGPQGTVQMDPLSHHATVNTALARCDAQGRFEIVANFGPTPPLLPERYRHLPIDSRAAHEENIRFQARMVEQMTEGVCLVRADDGIIVYANREFETMFACDRNEMVGQSLTRTYEAANPSPETITREITQHLGRKGVWKGELKTAKKDHLPFWCIVSISAMTHARHGEVWMATYQDITARKEIEERLLLKHCAIEESPVGIITVTIDGIIDHANPAAARLYGYDHGDELVGNPLDLLAANDLSPGACQEILASVWSGQSWKGVLLKRRKDGSQVWVHQHLTPIRGKDGGIHHLLAIHEDVTERRQYQENLEEIVQRRTEELEQARDAALAGARAKSDFLVNMSHEIRTPMNGVLGMAELIMSTPLTEQQRHYVETIIRSGSTLLRIINGILDLTKVQEGRLILELLRFDLAVVLRDLGSLFADQARFKGLAFRIAVAERVPIHLLGDPFRLNQILFNLTGNAIKFTDHGSVGLSVKVAEEREADVLLHFQVTDTGIGIDPEYQKQMFQAFSQEDPSVSRRFGGTGLGLAIARQLVSLMNGELAVASTPGQGSTFRFTARFGKQQPGDQTAIARWQAGQQVPTSDRVRFCGHLLLVEDNLVNQEVAVLSLQQFGCQVTVAADGREALSLVEQAKLPFDAIFMDCEMPVLDGFATTRQLRQWEQRQGKQRLPIIAMTAHVLAESRQQCSAAGMDDYLQKPFSQADLGRTLLRWLPQVEVEGTKDLGGEQLGEEATQPVPLLDPVALGRIQELDRQEPSALLGRLVAHYLARAPQLLAELEAAVARKDVEKVRVTAHALKSSSLTMGAQRLADLGKRMEAHHADLDLVDHLLRQCGTTLAETAQALRGCSLVAGEVPP